jgi:UDP-arabinose 4-epimerase
MLLTLLLLARSAFPYDMHEETTVIRILVTGGAGYIGSHTAKVLAAYGFEPVVLDNLSEGHRWAVRWGPFVQGDLADRELIRETIHRYTIEAVIHFAASAYVGESMQNPRKYFRNNVANTLTLLETMLDTGVGALIFSSTCATYGLPQCLPLREDHPQSPINPYGESKLFVEKTLQWYGQIYGLRWAVLRYFNAAGADPDGEIGEYHRPETHLIPRVIAAALGKVPYVDIYGTDYPTPDGTAIRDYVHVTDLAVAHVLALQAILDGDQSVALNLGTGTGYSVREVITAVEQVSGRTIAVSETGRRDGDPPVLVADSSAAIQLLRWTPRYKTLIDLIETAWRWQVSWPDRGWALNSRLDTVGGQ